MLRLTQLCCLLGSLAFGSLVHAELQVGAAVVDVTPDQLPVLVNGGMLSRTVDTIKTRVNARAIVVSDGDHSFGARGRRLLHGTAAAPGRCQAASCVSNSAGTAEHHDLGHPHSYRPLVLRSVGDRKPIQPTSRSSANVWPKRWSPPKPTYSRHAWAGEPVTRPEFTALRRWVRRPDRIDNDPFGNPTVRANMHSARNLDDVTGPSGPEDPELMMVAFESTEGAPIAILTNFSMHYFGDQGISADYFGLFCDGLQKYARSKSDHPDDNKVVALMSHGCSGDIWRRDYVSWKNSDKDPTIETYTQGLLEIAKRVYDAIDYEPAASVAMAETRLPMKYRVPDAQRLQWAREITERLEGQPPKDRVEVYAREQVLLHEMQQTQVVVQAIRIGRFGFVTTPNETYALTGLKLKTQSPLEQTMVIELANGADGYIPPPEQHLIGGYNTWAARSAGLEPQAEPRIVAAGLDLLERVSEKPRRHYDAARGESARRILDAQPTAYWRMHEMEGPIAVDESENGLDGVYDPPTLFFLEGPGGFSPADHVNRCVHFAGGRLRARLATIKNEYSVVLSFWNGMPTAARETTGWLISRDHPHGTSGRGDHLGLGGTATQPGKIIVRHGRGETSVGTTELQRWTWNKLAFVRQAQRLQVFLNGAETPELDVAVERLDAPAIQTFFFGGRSDNDATWEGKLDEVAVFARPLTSREATELTSR